MTRILKAFSATMLSVFFAALLFAVSSSAISATHWAVDYADFTMNMGIIECSSRSNFNENASFKRCEIVYSLAKIQGVSRSNSVNTGFSDVPSGHPYAGVIKWGVDNGIVTGHTDGTFRPNATVSRQQFCTFIYRYCQSFGISLPNTNGTPSFTDASSISSYAVDAVNALYRADIIRGYTDGSFHPTDDVILSEAANMLTNLHAIKNNPANAITIYVKKRALGEPVSNAFAYIYRPNDHSGAMYPYSPVVSSTQGIARMSNLTTTKSYAVNVISNGFGAASVPELIRPSRKYVFVELPLRAPGAYNRPVSDFSGISSWAHSGCSANCQNHFSRICPTSYYSSYYQQNFGWRYGASNNVEFHQGIDIVRAKGTPVYNVYNISSRVVYQGDLIGGGKTVQLRCGTGDTVNEYATYMHLDTITLNGSTTVTGGQKIGTVGSTGTSSAHLHFSLATSSIFMPKTAGEFAQFIDPFKFMT